MIAGLAHNLHRWTDVLGLPGQTPRRAHTLRRWLLELPGRLTRTTLHLPARWPWQADWIAALRRIRALPAPG